MFRRNKLKIYDKGLGKVKIKNRYSASDDILQVAISSDGHTFAAATFDRVYYFSEDKFQWKLNIDNFNSFSLSNCGRYLIICTLTRLIYLDAPHFKPENAYKEKTKELPDEIKQSNFWIQSVSDIDMGVISSDGKFVVIGGEKSLHLYTNLGEKMWSFEMGDKIWGITIAKNGMAISAGSGKEVYYFDQDGKLLWQFRTGNLVRFPYLTIDGKKVTVSSGGKVYVFSQRGQVLREHETGTAQTLGSSEDMATLAGGTSTGTFCFDSDGKKIWEKEEKDFINMIRVSANGEAVIVGTGSEVLNNPNLHVYHRDGTLLWSYMVRGLVKAVATDDNGHYIVAGIGRKVVRFENTLTITRTSITVSKRCNEIIDYLRSRGIDVSRLVNELKQYNEALENKETETALNNLLKLEKTLLRVKERYYMAKETIPNWLESIGISVEITDDLINGIFPLYNKYVDINDNKSLSGKSSQIDSYIRNLRKALESVDPRVIKDTKTGKKKPVLQQKLSVISITIDSISGLKKVVNNLKTEKINFIFELEDTTRNIILDHISGKNYEREIAETIQKAERFEEKIESLLHRIQKYEATIKLWREQETMHSPDSVLVGIRSSIKEEEGAVNLIITITNNFEESISKVNIRAFTKDSILNFIEPGHGVTGTVTEIHPERSEDFWLKLRSELIEDVVMNGILIFELDRIEYQVKLPPMNISLLSPNITGTDLSEADFSRTMEDDRIYQEALIVKNAELKYVMEYIRDRLQRFTVIRDKQATTDEGEARILWNAGKFGKQDLILVIVVVMERENMEIEIATSVYSTDMDKATAFIRDVMNYFRATYKANETGL